MGDFVGAAFSSVGTVFKFVDFCAKLKDVPLEYQVFCGLINNVRNDLNECSRILRNESVKQRLECDVGRNAHVERTIGNVKQALNEIGAYVESVSRDEERNGKIRLVHRFEWVLGHQAKLETREKRLAGAHASLLHVMNTLHTLEAQSPPLPSYNEAIEQSGDAVQMDDGSLISPDARWRRRRSEKEKSCEDLIDLREEEKDTHEQVPQQDTLSVSKIPVVSSTPTGSLLDAPLRLESSITSVSDIWNPPAPAITPAMPQISITELPCVTPRDPPVVVAQNSSAVEAQELPALSFPTSTITEIKVPEVSRIELRRDDSVRSTAEEERWRRRARQHIAFGS